MKMIKFKHIKTREQFIERANLKHNNLYDYSLVKFEDRGGFGTDAKTHGGCGTRKFSEYDRSAYVTIICSKHGPFTQQCRKHIEGSGCHKCAYEKIGAALAGRESTVVHEKKYFDGTLEIPTTLKERIRAALKNRQLLKEQCITKKFIIESPTHGDIQVLIDKKDWKTLSQYRWSATNCHKGRDNQQQFYINARIPLPNAPRYQYTHPSGYQRTYMRRKTLAITRLILDAPEGYIVDHINGNTLDNRRHNLRICTYQQNGQNSRSKIKTSHGYKGISRGKSKTNPWTVYIRINNKNVNLGSYATKEDAARSYDVAALINFGEFAYTNFPIENYL
tara:strand:+ start:193 stop:1194 length:1002 start_codon:yes stop_codon:yes gene_type:complete